jgi:hypothetical protein
MELWHFPGWIIDTSFNSRESINKLVEQFTRFLPGRFVLIHIPSSKKLKAVQLGYAHGADTCCPNTLMLADSARLPLAGFSFVLSFLCPTVPTSGIPLASMSFVGRDPPARAGRIR